MASTPLLAKKPVRATKPPGHMLDYVNGSEKEEIINHDWCDSCGEGGDLLCCDECPASFHLTCLDPPITKVPEGDWSCNRCRCKKKPKYPPSNPLVLTIVRKVANGNPSTFKVPEAISSMFEVGYGYEKDEFGFNTNGRFQVKKRKSQDSVCKVCKQDGEAGELALCSRCPRSYHLYCLDPPLLSTPDKNWQCPAHQIRASDSNLPSSISTGQTEVHPVQKSSSQIMNGNYVLPEETLHLDFGTFSVIPQGANSTKLNRRVQREPRRGIQKISASVDTVLTEASRQKLELINKALPTKDSLSIAEASCEQIKNLPPLFVQFLAWQRLMQIHQNVNSPNELAKSLEEFMASNSYLKATTKPSPLEVLASSKRHYSEIESKHREHERKKRRHDHYESRREREERHRRHSHHHSSRSSHSSRNHRRHSHESSHHSKNKHEPPHPKIPLEKTSSGEQVELTATNDSRETNGVHTLATAAVPIEISDEKTEESLSENDIPRLSPAIEPSESIETAQNSEPIHSETTPMLTSNASPASPQASEASEASEASDVSTSILDNIECEDQTFADILKQNEQVIEPKEEPSSEKDTAMGMEIEPKETPHIVPSQPTPTNTTPVQPPQAKLAEPQIYGTLNFVDPTLRWQSGSAIYEIKKKTIIIGRTRAPDSNLDVNMEGITENAKFVSHEHLKVTITNNGFTLSVLGRNPVSVDGKDYRRDSGPYVSKKDQCIFVLGKTEILLTVARRH